MIFKRCWISQPSLTAVLVAEHTCMVLAAHPSSGIWNKVAQFRPNPAPFAEGGNKWKPIQYQSESKISKQGGVKSQETWLQLVLTETFAWRGKKSEVGEIMTQKRFSLYLNPVKTVYWPLWMQKGEVILFRRPLIKKLMPLKIKWNLHLCPSVPTSFHCRWQWALPVLCSVTELNYMSGK